MRYENPPYIPAHLRADDYHDAMERKAEARAEARMMGDL